MIGHHVEWFAHFAISKERIGNGSEIALHFSRHFREIPYSLRAVSHHPPLPHLLIPCVENCKGIILRQASTGKTFRFDIVTVLALNGSVKPATPACLFALQVFPAAAIDQPLRTTLDLAHAQLISAFTPPAMQYSSAIAAAPPRLFHLSLQKKKEILVEIVKANYPQCWEENKEFLNDLPKIESRIYEIHAKLENCLRES